MNRRTKKRIQEFTFIVPALIMFSVFVAYPFLQGIPMSFTKWDGFNSPTFNGVRNYVRLVTNSAAAASMRNLVLWSIIAMTLHVGFGVLTAFVLYKKPKG